MNEPAVDEAALARQVLEADVELGVITRDEYRALWTPEELELDPDAGPVLDAALRSLAARGMATIEPTGAVTLGGVATFVRTARERNAGSVTVRWAPGGPLAVTTWALVQPDVVLELAWDPAGVATIALRRVRRAISALVRTLRLAPAADAEPAVDAERWEWHEGDAASTQRLSEVLDRHREVTLLSILRSVVDDRGRDLGWASFDALVATGEGGGVLVLDQGDGRSTVERAHAGQLRALLASVLGSGGTSTSPVGVAPSAGG